MYIFWQTKKCFYFIAIITTLITLVTPFYAFEGSAIMKKIDVIDPLLQKELNELPNQPILHAILEKRSGGNFFSAQPHKYVLVKMGSKYTFLAGDFNEIELKNVADFLSTYKEISLICNERYHQWFLKNGYTLCPRIELRYFAPDVTLPIFPNNVSIKNINADIFPYCMWYQFTSTLCGTPENFLKNGFGIALCINDRIISEAYGAAISKGLCEIGIVTHPDFQGQGFATIAVKHILKQCLNRHLLPVWSCNYENTASWKVALKSGFSITRYYAFMNKAN